MKKTLLITSYFPPRRGGISNFLFNVYNAMDNNFFVLTDYPGQVKNNNIIRKSFNTNIFWPRWLPLLFKTYKIIKEEKIELLQAGQIIPIGTVCYLLKKIIGIKYHVYVYGNDLLIARDSKRKMKIIDKVLSNAEKVIACSTYTKTLAVEHGAIKEKTIIVFPIPKKINTNNYTPKDVSDFKKKNNIDNKKIILSVGNLVKRKGHDMVIKSLVNIKDKIGSYVYLIIGSGPYKNKLETMIGEEGMDDNIKILDNVSNQELALFYSSCDLFIMPSRFLKNEKNKPIDVEGFGMVFLEANLYGKPVIGGNVGGQLDAIEESVSGYLVDPSSIDKISSKIELLLNNQELAIEIGASGKERVLSNFSWEKEVSKIKEIIS